MSQPLSFALFQPDIPGNTGTIIRLAACLGMKVEIIGPAGFDFSDRALKRAGMDYIELAAVTRHDDWTAFDAWRKDTGRRLVLFTTQGAQPYTDIAYRSDDILLFGRESAGAPLHVHDEADIRAIIPMAEGRRSLNLAVAAAMAAGEATRQIRI